MFNGVVKTIIKALMNGVKVFLAHCFRNKNKVYFGLNGFKEFILFQT